MFKIVENVTPGVAIKVVGVGGGGGNALEHMIRAGIEGVEFIAANTDSQALKKSSAATALQLGERATSGLGAGADPALGREAALEARESIEAALAGTDMVFIAAGMGGGTGTGAAPVISEIASSAGSLTVAVVTKPFPFELKKRMQVAVEGIRELNQHVDALITIPNEKLITVLGKDRPLTEAFREVDDVLLGAVQGIAELITSGGLINLDFADVKTVMLKAGMAMMGCGRAEGENRAHDAAQAAINNPLLEDIDLSNASGLLVNIMSSDSLTTGEIDTIGQCMSSLAAPDATVVVGTVINEDMGDTIRVTLIATGLGDTRVADGKSALTDAPAAGSVVAWPDAEAAEARSGSYEEYDIPAVIRHGSTGREQEKEHEEYLDIPAFLRHQAD